MATIIINKSVLNKEVLVEKKTDKEFLSQAVFECYEVQGLYIIAQVNDTVVPVEDWRLFGLKDDDRIVITARPQKGALPFIGVAIGLAVVFFFPPGYAWSASFAALATGAAIGYAIGSMADSLIFPPSMPSVYTGSGSGATSNPNYGWSGAKLVTQPGLPKTVLYGQHQISGTLIMQSTSTDGDKNYLKMLIALGQGEIEGIMKSDGTGVCASNTDTPDIEINGQPYYNFDNISWDFRLGTYDQSVIDGFHETQTFYADGRKVTASAVTYTSTGLDIDAFEVQITSPVLFKQASNGNVGNNSIKYVIEYQIDGAGAWTDGGTFTMTGASKTAIYEYRKYENLTQGKYNVKVTRLSPEYTSFKTSGDLYLGGVTEIAYGNIAYRNTALLSLEIQASDQLSGTTPNVTVIVRGTKVLVPKLTISAVTQTYDDCYWDDTAGAYKRTSDDVACVDAGIFVRQWSRNPIWCTRDFYLNKRYGLGYYIDSDSFNDAAAAIEAKYCWEQVTDFDGGSEHRFEMDLPMSNFMSAEEAKKLLTRCFRGWVIYSNGQHKPVIDRESESVQTFNGSSINPKSVKITYLKTSQISNIVEMQYADPDRNYNIETLEVVDEDEWTTVKPPRINSINAIGTVRRSQNLRDGKYYLNISKRVKKLVEYISPGDAIRCEPGDTIRIQDDLMAWGVGGRVVAADADSVTTNIDVTYSVGYEIRVRLPDFSLEVKTVSSVTNNGRKINVSSSFSAVPLVDSVFTYGATDVDSKPFKVKAITRLEDTDKEREQYKLLVAEESSNKYTDTTGVSLPDPDYTNLTSPSDVPENVIDLALAEMSNKLGFYVAFNIPQSNFSWHHADLFLSMDNLNWWIYRSNIISRSNIEVTSVKPGQVYYVKIVSYNRFGIANLTPETDNITIRGSLFIPLNINGLRLDGESTLNTTVFTKRDAKFAWRKLSVTSGAGNLPAGQETLGAGEYSDDVSFKYWVEIWVSGSMVRKEIVSDNAYVYTYEKNVADNGTASNSFTIKVWGYYEDANYKSNSSSDLLVSNPAPDAVSGLAATPWMEGVKFTWDPSTDVDFAGYYSVRHKVATDAWSDWSSFSGTSYFRTLTETEVTDHGSEATVYFEIKAIDIFGSSSGAVDDSAVCLSLNIQPADIADFAVTASKTFTKIPIITGDSWTNDSPGAGSVAWNEHSLIYNGAAYTIVAGNTSDKYIYWNGSDSSYSTSATNPVLTDGQFIIAVNISGSHDLAWNAIANQVIGSAYIEDLAVVTAKMDDLAVTNAKVNDLSASKITTGYLSADRIEAGSIVLEKVAGLGYLASQDTLDGVPDGDSYGRVALTSISAGKIIVAGLDNNVTERMFTATNIKSTIEGWRHASDTTLIDGGDIYADSVTADAIKVSSLDALSANLGTVTAGLAKSSDGKIQLDLDNKWLKVWDSSATPVLRVHLGYIP